jgi:predicted GTPase
VIAGTPCDLGHLITTQTPIVRARYEYDDVDEPRLSNTVMTFLQDRKLAMGHAS